MDVILDPGRSGDDYRPAVTLEHDARRSELYVVVGEEVGGMIEGVSEGSFRVIKQRLNPAWWEQQIANQNVRRLREEWSCPVCGADA